MPYKKPVIEKMFYSMRETSEMFDIPQSTIRFWENEFDILKPYKNTKGTRYFRPEDLKNLHLIYFLLKEQGMTLKGAKKKLEENPEKTIKTFEIATRLSSVRDQLKQILENLD
ncbi:MerR family transcriptional regulator [Saccharicrinis sp. FJH2]|uniref:MerR family transcriptional regulator n=1 Tax=unclassified Saccharicrinis TaxID=2646859 RepID=UPI0035D492DC